MIQFKPAHQRKLVVIQRIMSSVPSNFLTMLKLVSNELYPHGRVKHNGRLVASREVVIVMDLHVILSSTYQAYVVDDSHGLPTTILYT